MMIGGAPVTPRSPTRSAPTATAPTPAGGRAGEGAGGRAAVAAEEPMTATMDRERLAALTASEALKDLEQAEMDVVELSLREHVQAESPRAGPPGVQVSLHWSTPAGRRCVAAGETTVEAEAWQGARPHGFGNGSAAPLAGTERAVGARRVASNRRAPNFADNASLVASPTCEVRLTCRAATRRGMVYGPPAGAQALSLARLRSRRRVHPLQGYLRRLGPDAPRRARLRARASGPRGAAGLLDVERPLATRKASASVANRRLLSCDGAVYMSTGGPTDTRPGCRPDSQNEARRKGGHHGRFSW